MNKFTQALIGALLCLWAQNLVGQRDYRIQLQASTISINQPIEKNDFTTEDLQTGLFGEYHYLILQFKDIPGPTQRQELEDLGISLLGYLPNYAYWAKIPIDLDLETLPARGVAAPLPHYKYSHDLFTGNSPSHALSEQGMYMEVFPFASITPDELKAYLENQGFLVQKTTEKSVQLYLEQEEVNTLAQIGGVEFIDFVEAPPIAEGMGGGAYTGSHHFL